MKNKRYHKAVAEGYKGSLRQWANENYKYGAGARQNDVNRSVEEEVKYCLRIGTYRMSE